MTTAEIQTAMAECRNCAMVMLENASFIQTELSNVHLDADLVTRTEQVCSGLIGTKHDVISDLFELDDKLQAADIAQAHDLAASTLERLVAWMAEDMVKMHDLVVALEAASKREPKSGSAFMLVLESATNILNAFNRVRAAVEAI
jgi:response regulator of citrate/malate metabolism